MAVVAMANLKGGVGKTSTAMHLGGAMARRGLRVLLVDNDAQCSLTRGLTGNEVARELPPETTIFSLYADVPATAEDLLRPTGFEGLTLLAGSPHIVGFNLPHPHRLGPEVQARLSAGLRPLAAGFDVTLIDCCPNLQLLTWAALLASDAVLIPTQPELYGAQGLAEVRDWVELVERTWDRTLPIAGVLMTMFSSRRAMHRTFSELLAAECPELLSVPVPESADFPEAVAARRPVHWHKPRGAASRAMDDLAGEFLGRLDGLGLIANAAGQSREAA